jgi:CRP-like cAMP-binding protein
VRQLAEMDIRKKALSKVALFSGLTEEELAKLAKALRNTPFIKDDIITRQGAVAHWLYLLVNGEADVWFESEGQERIWCATLKAGDVFGEIGLLTGAPRGATVTARTDALCYRLDKENFENILHDRPELADVFAHVLSDRNQVLDAIRSDHHEPVQTQQANYLASIRRFFRLH